MFSTKKNLGSPQRVDGGKKILKDFAPFADCKERIFGPEDPTKPVPKEKKGGKRIYKKEKRAPESIVY